MKQLLKWKQFTRGIRRWRSARILEKQDRILREGVCIHARLLDFHPTGKNIEGLDVFRCKMCIVLPDGTKLHACTTTLSSRLQPACRGKILRMRILPGDLSHIVLYI